MPGFNKRGPNNRGPLTGKGMGFCVVPLQSPGSNVDNAGDGNKNNPKEVFDMPGGDRTGPAGMGPMTGRAAGYCAGYPVPGYMNPATVRGRGFFGFGYGRGGRGRGWGRGMRWRGYAYPAPYYYPQDPYAPELNPQDEVQMLKEQARGLQEELNAVSARIKELESKNSQRDK